MSTNRLSVRMISKKSEALRLLVGVPALCAIMALCAWAFWACNGFPPELAPHHWLAWASRPCCAWSSVVVSRLRLEQGCSGSSASLPVCSVKV